LIEDLTQRFPTFASFFAIEDEQYDILWHHRLGHCSLVFQKFMQCWVNSFE